MKLRIQIWKTVWINILGIFLSAYLFGIISELAKLNFNNVSSSELTNSLAIGFFGGLFAVIGYGFIFWLGFIVVISLLELTLMSNNKERVKAVLLIEWIIISSPFIYWTFQYSQWIFLVAVIAFLITQFIRKKRIFKAILNQ
jgi:hypothetical protein